MFFLFQNPLFEALFSVFLMGQNCHIYVWSGPYRQPDRKISFFYDSSVLGGGKKRSFYGQAEHKGIKEPYSNAIIGAKFSRLLTVRMGGGGPPLLWSA